MDGKQLLRFLRDLLNESSSAGWWDEYSAYNYLYQAATEFVIRTRCLRHEQSITTVSGTASYRLNADYLDLYLRDSTNRYYVKFNDGTTDHFLSYRPYEDIYYENNTDSVSIPDYFSIIDDPTMITTVSGTATSAGARSPDSCTLTDSTADFSSISKGDAVHNTTDSAMGVVLGTGTTSLLTALFDGTDNDWDLSDAYHIVPQSRYRIVLDPPPSVSAYTLTVPYVQKPDPVYSYYGIYRLPAEVSQALAQYAFWLFKYRDSQPNFGDKAFQFFDSATKRYGNAISNRIRNNRRMQVNAKVRT